MASFERFVVRVKNLLFPPGPKVRTPPAGLLRGLRFEIDFHNQVQIYLGLSEREVIPWFRALTATAATAVDIGAAEGRYTIPLLAGTRASRVLAFEPTERRDGLAANLALNDLADDPRLTIVPRLVGATPAGDTVTLDAFLDELSFPCFVKMDVEGAEADVLRGATGLLQRPAVSWIIETHSPGVEAECVTLLEAAGYRTWIVRNARWRRFVPLPGLGPIGHNRWLAATNDPALESLLPPRRAARSSSRSPA